MPHTDPNYREGWNDALDGVQALVPAEGSLTVDEVLAIIQRQRRLEPRHLAGVDPE